MADRSSNNVLRWLFDPRHGLNQQLIPRWLFLRALALIYLSAFYSLLFQIKGLIGPSGILPAQDYLAAVTQQLGPLRLWYAPSLFWLSTSYSFLMAVTWLGLLAALAAFFNLWPRLSFAICFVCFLSFVAASSVFSSYQSDGMLLEAGFLALFFTPSGFLPGFGAHHLPSRASYYLLLWEWFRIYFESGLVKLLSGDIQWRNFTAMDSYYQNGPLPTWIGWYAQHLPHWFHAATVGATLAMELGIVLLMVFPRRFRLLCFCIVTPWQIAVILTANYTFLNYLVLALGILLLDDKYLARLIPQSWGALSISRFLRNGWEGKNPNPSPSRLTTKPGAPGPSPLGTRESTILNPSLSTTYKRPGLRHDFTAIPVAISALFLSLVAYNTTLELIGIPLRTIPGILQAPVTLLDPFRIANQYGLFAVMTRNRYEVEFQGSNDDQNWTAYPFRNKPQAINEPPRIYAPYQPRFDWNLWFASLSTWQQNEFVPLTEERLLTNDADVLSLFKSNPFPQAPPHFVRAVLWQYWFTTMEEKRQTGNWWHRSFLGIYAPVLTLKPDGTVDQVQPADDLPEHN